LLSICLYRNSQGRRQWKAWHWRVPAPVSPDRVLPDFFRFLAPRSIRQAAAVHASAGSQAVDDRPKAPVFNNLNNKHGILVIRSLPLGVFVPIDQNYFAGRFPPRFASLAQTRRTGRRR